MSDDHKPTPPEEEASDESASNPSGESESEPREGRDSDARQQAGESDAEGADESTASEAAAEPALASDDSIGEDEDLPGSESEEDDGSMRALLRGAFEEEEEPQPRSDVLRGVQDKLRKRSGGKFYADGWSTARHPPTMTYLWTSVIMLAVVVVAYAVLASLVGEAKSVPMTPAPIRIIPPKPGP